ncbi:hypothetical protein AB4Z40_33080 [Bosea sp. 2YAB26]|uniref:hypothetical protein n=1 Tax=Bosea sp. 2YAB26 TaxID=3237478 RepID=UPI003F923C15
MKITEHDIRDGESSRDYVRRIPLWRLAALLVIGVGAFVGIATFFAMSFVTFRQFWMSLPFWANIFIFLSFFIIVLAVVSVIMLRDSRRR